MTGCKSAKLEQVIVTKTVVGTGTENDPVREVVQYWDLQGKLLVEKDPCTTVETVRRIDD